MEDLTKKLIGTSIYTALETANIKQKELAKELNVTDNTVSYWCNGIRVPNTEQIIHIAKFLNVSTDYLLGFTKNPTTDKDERFITEYTGLNHDAIKILHWLSNSEFKEAINHLLCHIRFVPLINYLNEGKYDLKLAVNLQKKYLNTDNDKKDWIDFESIENLHHNWRYNFFETIEIFKEIIKDYTKEIENEYRQNDSNLPIK